jgi:D-arabinose 1-dehydrogenase-like Zn-dependent alcohol dehydrogenase
MTIEAVARPTECEPELRGQTVVVIGGSAGIGLETARRARAEGAEVILTGRNPDRLKTVAAELGAVSSATLDADDSAALEVFFADFEGPIDHVMVTAGGPYYAPLAEMDFDEARRALQEHPMVMVGVAPARPGQGPPRKHAAVHGRHRGAPLDRGCGDQLGDQLEARRNELRDASDRARSDRPTSPRWPSTS